MSSFAEKKGQKSSKINAISMEVFFMCGKKGQNAPKINATSIEVFFMCGKKGAKCSQN